MGVENAYEYEPAGIGGCASTATGGCVGLISSGSSQKESAFLEATPSGNDVFFLTAAQLSPQDTDDAFDIYDARVCTQRIAVPDPTAKRAHVLWQRRRMPPGLLTRSGGARRIGQRGVLRAGQPRPAGGQT